MQVTRRITLLVLIQELLVVAQQLVADGGGLVVGGEVAHVGEDAACKIDVPAPPLRLIIPLVSCQATTLDDLSIQAKDIQRGVVAAMYTAYVMMLFALCYQTEAMQREQDQHDLHHGLLVCMRCTYIQLGKLNVWVQAFRRTRIHHPFAILCIGTNTAHATMQYTQLLLNTYKYTLHCSSGCSLSLCCSGV